MFSTQIVTLLRFGSRSALEMIRFIEPRCLTCSSDQSVCTTVARIPAGVQKTRLNLSTSVSRVSRTIFTSAVLSLSIVILIVTNESLTVFLIQFFDSTVQFADFLLVLPQLRVSSLFSWIERRSFQLCLQTPPVCKPAFPTTLCCSTVPGKLLIKL